MRFITTPKQAVQHLAGKLTGKDLAALKILIKELDMMYSDDKDQNWLFAKLYLSIFNSELERTGSSRSTADTILFQLRKPMDSHFKQIQFTFEHLQNIKTFDLRGEKNTSGGNIQKSHKSVTEVIKKPSIDLKRLKETLIEKINLSLNDQKNYG